ncbi:MAG: hypothetical protein HY658_08690 [Actinobacteria bacterium]|nr:hypothetical protein [Actinomycetota bacterium]
MDPGARTSHEAGGLPDGPPGIPGAVLSAVVGGLWGLAGYLILWGHVPLVVSRSFVQSRLGTALLLPVRAVLWGIRMFEEHVAGRPVHLADSNWWIGAVAGAIGAAIGAGGFLLSRAAFRGLARSRAPGPGAPEPHGRPGPPGRGPG